MNNTKTLPQMEQFFKEIKYLDKQNKFTIEFFTGIAPLYASHLYAGLEGGYCDEESIDVICEMFTVLLNNGFVDSVYDNLKTVQKTCHSNLKLVH